MQVIALRTASEMIRMLNLTHSLTNPSGCLVLNFILVCMYKEKSQPKPNRASVYC